MGYIPLTDKVLENLGYNPKPLIAYHAMALEHLKGLSKIQKKKTSVSTFTKNLGSIIKNITGKPELVAELEGTAILSEDFDLFSQVDSSGLRWISSTSLFKDKTYEFWYSGVSKDILKEISNINKIDLKELKNKTASDIVGILQDMSKKDMDNIRKTYIKSMEHSTSIKVIKDLFAKEFGKESKNKKYNHNEILLENFTIKGVYAIQANKFQYKSNNPSDLSFIESQIKQEYDCIFKGFVEKEQFSYFPKKY